MEFRVTVSLLGMAVGGIELVGSHCKGISTITDNLSTVDTVVIVFTVNCTDSLSLPERLWPAVNGPGRLAVCLHGYVCCVSVPQLCML